MRNPVGRSILCAAILLSVPVYAAADDVSLDEITIRIIDNEDAPIDINDIALPPANSKRRGPASENADERALQGSGNSLEAIEKASQASSNAAMRASQAREEAAEASANTNDRAHEAAENAAEAASDAAMRAEQAAEKVADAAEKAAEAAEKAAEAAEQGRNKGKNRNR